MADFEFSYTDDDAHDASRMSNNLDRAIVQAEREALRRHQVTVRPSNLLVGLLQQSEAAGSEAVAILKDLNVSIPALVKALDGPRRAATDKPGASSTKLQLAAAANNAMGLAFEEAGRRRSAQVGTGHMLLGLLREPTAEVSNVLSEFGVSEATVRRQLDARLKARLMASDNPPRVTNTISVPTSSVKTPKLDAYSRDVTAMARSGKLDPYVGDKDKLREILNILGKRTKNNPCLIGEPGVGKTAQVEGLAQYLLDHPEEFPEHLRGKRIVSLDLGSMVAGSKYRGEFEERLKGAMKDAMDAQDVILFIDEFHTVVGAGSAEGAMDAANLLKPLIARGELQIIGATTLDEFRKHVEKDAALERRFRPVYIDEPSREKTVEILRGIREKNEQWHKVKITDGALETAARLAERFITTRRQPDKSLDLVDEACSRANIKMFEMPEELRVMEAQVNRLADERKQATSVETREELRAREIKLREKYLVARDEWDSRTKSKDIVIDDNSIAEVVTAWTGIPVAKLTETESAKLVHLEEHLHKRVISQDPAISAVSKAVRRARAGVKDPKRPSGVFIFLGPTGVGKTELAKALAEFLFDSEDAMVRLDMSEFQEKHTVSRLVGSPPGYVGYDDGGQLTEPVRRRPFSVVLLDEIEKAHPDVFNVLLQVMDDGRLTDSKGREANFKDTVLIMTSNLGVRPQGIDGGVGLGPVGWAAIADVKEGATVPGAMEPYDGMKERVMGAVKQTFKPEWLNRVDDVIVFGHLTRPELREIVDLKSDMLDKRIYANAGIHVTIDKAGRDHLLDLGFDPDNGARPINRAMLTIEDALADEILARGALPEDTVKVGYSAKTKDFTFTVVSKAVAPKTAAAPEAEERQVA